MARLFSLVWMLAMMPSSPRRVDAGGGAQHGEGKRCRLLLKTL